ncbi:transcription termination factor 3, mitochondrial isoform X2 [Engystomops pustulosus]|uniref:transcription termination factor 3, mitochondrial isoform X2 n=1 Tax=Engystomops pustulosus TaxID=76066 RepID=UPI003AFB7B78
MGLWDLPPISPLEEITEEDAAMIVPPPPRIPPESFTLRHYVDSSETLQKLVLLGVDLSQLEKRPNVGTFLLKLDFEKDISKILFFLKDVGVEDKQLGAFLTKNPFILSEDLDNLQKRVAYLSSKKFSRQAIARIVSRAPYLLNFSVERLDNRLGFFQKQLGLSGEKTRDLVTRLPRMITGSLEPIKENLKVFELEFGFRRNEIQQLALKVPKMLAGNKKKLTETFDFVHNTMGIPHHIITHFPQVFNTNLMRIKERHQFLTFLGRAKYDPTEPNYVSLDKLVSMPDPIFCEEVAKTSIQEFEQFQKNM